MRLSANKNAIETSYSLYLTAADIHIEASNLLFSVSNNYDVGMGASSYDIRPYYRWTDSITDVFQTAGYITSSGHNLRFSIPLCRPIAGCDDGKLEVTIQSATNGGLRVRQNGNYLYESSGSAYTSVDSECFSNSYVAAGGNWINVIVDMSDFSTSDVINNAPVGIEAYLTITFHSA